VGVHLPVALELGQVLRSGRHLGAEGNQLAIASPPWVIQPRLDFRSYDLKYLSGRLRHDRFQALAADSGSAPLLTELRVTQSRPRLWQQRG
jgi:hypothetical protein